MNHLVDRKYVEELIGAGQELKARLLSFAGALADRTDCSGDVTATQQFDVVVSKLETADQIPDFQQRVHNWTVECFGSKNAYTISERTARFLEEALELAQALHCSRSDVLKLVDYVYSRPIGNAAQEVGGVALTLAALCSAANVSLTAAAEEELARVSEPKMIERIRTKNASKPENSPLPGKESPTNTDEQLATDVLDLITRFRSVINRL